MNLMQLINEMPKEELIAFAQRSLLNVPADGSPEETGVHLYVTMPLRGKDPLDAIDLMMVALDPQESSVAARSFLTGIRLAQHLIDTAN